MSVFKKGDRVEYEDRAHGFVGTVVRADGAAGCVIVQWPDGKRDRELIRLLKHAAPESDLRKVHDHGPEEGRGLDCAEFAHADGRPVGACIVNAEYLKQPEGAHIHFETPGTVKAGDRIGTIGQSGHTGAFGGGQMHSAAYPPPDKDTPVFVAPAKRQVGYLPRRDRPGTGETNASISATHWGDGTPRVRPLTAEQMRFAADSHLTGEVRTTSSTGGQKGVKPEMHSLIPTKPLAQVARHYGIGAEKYDKHQWRQGYEWSKSFDALQRHAQAFWGGEDIDAETQSPHMAAVAFHALTLLAFMDEHPNHDDRYKKEES
ncbi:dATP/dGTP diphosphohydrolase domain-containing protein [Paeniglutamicibacter terrestris]|uniref:dATP/dGTP diphosphohydrolase N-terminal domain-containing protein n=1 Tax=Paeniglutamicibacter terrestris TaxID=2723403 RepID=A0ABX1G530_9MICC|nr:dATP/dGTP diphosphohydrolase domain-containing protein [Paeniglutamicibacter terrestris]NKG21069.1 hypothetical protein [Paeniglutamicibacter terrestris]